MLHHGHQLDGVVAQLGDAGQHVPGELSVLSYSALGRGDPHVALVDAHTGWTTRTSVLELMTLWGGGGGVVSGVQLYNVVRV